MPKSRSGTHLRIPQTEAWPIFLDPLLLPLASYLVQPGAFFRTESPVESITVETMHCLAVLLLQAPVNLKRRILKLPVLNIPGMAFSLGCCRYYFINVVEYGGGGGGGTKPGAGQAETFHEVPSSNTMMKFRHCMISFRFLRSFPSATQSLLRASVV